MSSYPSRRSLRLRGYDYSQRGAYFVTICAESRRCVFGAISDGHMELNAIGTMIQRVWGGLPGHYSGLELDEFIVMPNHLHGILVLSPAEAVSPPEDRQGPGRARQEPAPTLRLREWGDPLPTRQRRRRFVRRQRCERGSAPLGGAENVLAR